MRRAARVLALLVGCTLLPSAGAQVPPVVTQPAGAPVTLMDLELSPTLLPLAPEPGLCAIDDDGSGGWNPGEPLYIDVDSTTCATDSEPNDVRLVPSAGKPAGSRIRPGDADMGVAPLVGAAQPNDDLKYFDANGDGVWTPGDTLYLDIRNAAADAVHVGDLRLSAHGTLAAGTVAAAGDPDINLPLADMGLDVADTGALSFFDVDGDGVFSTDDALYVNPDALAVFGILLFPADVPVTQDVRLTPLGPYPFGSVVTGLDLDTVAPLRVTGMAGAITGNLCFVDDDGSGGYEAGEPVYFHVHAACAGESAEPTDLRLVPSAGKPGGTIVARGDADDDAPLTAGLDDGLKFYDANGEGALNPGDTAYLDIVDDASGTVHVGDVRLTPFGAAPAFAWVKAGDPDVNLGLVDTAVDTADANVLAYLDSSKNERLDVTDLAYLNTDGEGLVPTVGTELVEVGDVRLWSPLALLPGGRVTGPMDPDVSPRLQVTGLVAEACFVDDDGSGGYNPGEAIVVDVDGGACADAVEGGDLRLTPGGGKPAGSRVRGTDGDLGQPLSGGLAQGLLFYDADGDGAFTLGDTLYLDLGTAAVANVGDLRLSPLGEHAAFTTVVAGDPDANDPLTDFPAAQGGAHAVTTVGHLAYYDLDGNGGLSAADVFYIVRLGNGDDEPLISIGDVRLMPLQGLDLTRLAPLAPPPSAGEPPATAPPLADLGGQLQALLAQNRAVAQQLNATLGDNAALQDQIGALSVLVGNQTQQLSALNTQLTTLRADNARLSEQLSAKPAATPAAGAALVLAALAAAGLAWRRRM